MPPWSSRSVWGYTCGACGCSPRRAAARREPGIRRGGSSRSGPTAGSGTRSTWPPCSLSGRGLALRVGAAPALRRGPRRRVPPAGYRLRGAYAPDPVRRPVRDLPARGPPVATASPALDLALRPVRAGGSRSRRGSRSCHALHAPRPRLAPLRRFSRGDPARARASGRGACGAAAAPAQSSAGDRNGCRYWRGHRSRGVGLGVGLVLVGLGLGAGFVVVGSGSASASGSGWGSGSASGSWSGWGSGSGSASWAGPWRRRRRRRSGGGRRRRGDRGGRRRRAGAGRLVSRIELAESVTRVEPTWKIQTGGPPCGPGADIPHLPGLSLIARIGPGRAR